MADLVFFVRLEHLDVLGCASALGSAVLFTEKESYRFSLAAVGCHETKLFCWKAVIKDNCNSIMAHSLAQVGEVVTAIARYRLNEEALAQFLIVLA